MSTDTFPQDEKADHVKRARTRVLKTGMTFDSKKYDVDDSWRPANIDNPLEIHSTGELVEAMKKHKGISVEARILGSTGNHKAVVKMKREAFLECAKKRESKRLRETFDMFANDGGDYGNTIGRDFTPLLGGPFNKQLYYRDYLRMISTCFYAFHHDPVARDVVSIITDFTIGRGFKVEAKGKDKDKAQVLWNAFSKVNDIPQQYDWAASEISIYGETMWWKLPKNQTRISLGTNWLEKIPTGVIPRIRLTDPSNIAEIITVPEDMIKGVIAYVWLAPTQYQMYSDGTQPSAKFIYTQIPAEQMMHFKVNTVSNEKRGRSDYFPALGYMKRLRDSVDYSLVAQQKAAAWSIDTTIKGDDQDIDDYIQSQQALGPIPPAGSEFVHTEAITKTYLGAESLAGGKDSPTFNWALNMICMAAGIPLSYFGTHLSGAGTRANALVSTEPVAKRFERRRNVYTRMIEAQFDWLMREFGLNAECETVFPELITQDRSAMLKDLAMAESLNWIAPETAAVRAAKEFDLKDYDWKTEQAKIKAQPPIPAAPASSISPLTAPGLGGQNKSNSSIPGSEKAQIKNNLGNL
jgi:hypothetical protein